MVFNTKFPELTAQEKAQIERRRNVAQGVEVLHGGGDKDETTFDIVAVPGLGTDPVECWNWPARNTMSTEEQKLLKTGRTFNWLKDPNGLHAEQPRARIMLYNYTSAWQGTFKVSNSLLYLAEALLVGLNERRKDESTWKRPIIFIGHSMGGLVISKALCLADVRPVDFPNIVPFVTGCYFFGTPFKGAGLAQLALAYNDMRKYFYDEDSYTELLKFMTPENDDLRGLISDFRSLARRTQPEIKLYCFYEQWPFNWLETIEKVTRIPVPTLAKEAVKKLQQKRDAYFVTQDSAILPEETPRGLNANHSDLVRFTGANDLNFRHIMGYINEVASDAVSTVRSRTRKRGLDDFQVACIRNLLESSANMRAKLDGSLGVSAEDTWLVEQPTFDKWRRQLEQPRSCLWIDGPPGYGKTAASIAATRYIKRKISEEQREHPSQKLRTLWACFFCDQQPYCSTAEDLLKSILLQLIDHYPKLAVYAENFLDKHNRIRDLLDESRDHPSNTAGSKNRNSRRLYKQIKATMTIEHLWQCLMDTLKDISLHTVYIIVNNIHRLDQNESLAKLLELIKSDVTRPKSMQDNKYPVQQGRWFFTSSSYGRSDIQTCMRHEDVHSNVYHMDLQDTQYKANVQMALTHHVRTKAHNLSKVRGYDKGLAFEVEKIVDSKAENKKWVDIIFLQLEALPENCSRLGIKDRLDAAARGDLRKLVEEAWQWIFDKMATEFKCKVKDVLRALVLLAENVTLEELSVLTRYSPEELQSFIDACAPLLLIDKVKQRISFVDDLVKSFLLSDWDTLLTSSISNAPQEEVEKQIVWQHGYLTWNCFVYLEKALSPKGTSIAESRLTRGASLASKTEADRSQPRAHTNQSVQNAGGVDQQNHANTAASPLAYPLKRWKHHAIAGGQHTAESLCTDMSGFWEEGSDLRQNWLENYVKVETDFVDLNIKNMTALHVTSALGLVRLSSSLLETDCDKKLKALDENQYTPLHLAAFNNHLDVVKLLLEKGAEIDASMSVASPLHLAAVRGNVNIMRVLLESKSLNIANPNAICDQYGPVINASIQSGVSEGVKELLKHKDQIDLTIKGVEPALVLSARISKPSLFQELLEVGKGIWDEEHYEEAMIEASRSGRVECVKALIECDHYFTKSCLKTSILKAGVGDNWEVVAVLIEHENFGDSPADYYDIFFLAAATTFAPDGLLEHIKKLAKDDIPTEIVDAALYQATDNQKATTVTWLLGQCKANPNATSSKPAELDPQCFARLNTDSYGDALTAAAFDNSFAIVQTLLDHNAQVDSVHGAALQIAARQGHLSIVDLLLDRGADIDWILEPDLMRELNMNEYPGTALQIACDFKQLMVVKRLLERGANPNLSHPESKFTRPIISATENKQPDILKYLLEVSSTEVNVQGGKRNNFPLQSACEDMDLDCVKRLLDRGANINVVDSKGNQAIHMAASHGNTNVLKFLLANNADVTHCSQEKGLALQEALKQKHLDCGSLLADAIAPILEALVTAAAKNNKFAKSVIENPGGEHPHIDTEKFGRVLEENALLRERNHHIELTLNDYKAMEKRLEDHQKIAAQKQQIADSAWAELQETHRRYDCSIEGYDAVNRHRKSLLQELEEVRVTKAREHDAERTRLENEVTCLRQQLQTRSKELDDQQKQSAGELYVLQHALQTEKLRGDQLEAHVWELAGSNQVLRTNENVGSLAPYDNTTYGSSTERLSGTESEAQKSSRYSFSDESDELYPTTAGSIVIEIDQAEPVPTTFIKRKKVRAPLMKIASELNIASKDKWKSVVDATQTQVASASLSAKTTIEDLTERAKAKALPKRISVIGH